MKMKKIFRVAVLAVAATLIFTANALGGEVVNLVPDWFIGGGAVLADAFASAAETSQGTAKVSDKPAHNKSTVSKVLTKIMPSQFPLDQMLRDLSTETTSSTKYEYFKVRSRAVCATVAEAVTGSTTSLVNIKVNAAHFFSVNGNVLVPSFNATGISNAATAVAEGGLSFTPLVLHICAVDWGTNTISVMALNATGVPDIPKDTKLYRMGTAMDELAARSEDPLSQPVKDYNYCQIHMTTVSEGVYQKLQEKEVPYGLAEFKEQALYDFRMTNEIDALFGTAQEFVDKKTNKTKYTADGLVRKISSHKFDFSNEEKLTEDHLQSMIAQLYNCSNGSDERYLYYGTELGSAIAGCRTIYKSLEAGKTEVRFGITFNRIDTNYGTLLLKYHPLFNICGYSRAGIVVDPANVYRCIQKPLEATPLDLDKSGQSRSKDIRIDESHTLAVTNPDTHAMILV